MKSIKGVVKKYAQELGVNMLVKDMKSVKGNHHFKGHGYNHRAYKTDYLITMRSGSQYVLTIQESKEGSAIMVPVSIF